MDVRKPWLRIQCHYVERGIINSTLSVIKNDLTDEKLSYASVILICHWLPYFSINILRHVWPMPINQTAQVTSNIMYHPL